MTVRPCSAGGGVNGWSDPLATCFGAVEDLCRFAVRFAQLRAGPLTPSLLNAARMLIHCSVHPYTLAASSSLASICSLIAGLSVVFDCLLYRN
jgi:hypothetical protein